VLSAAPLLTNTAITANPSLCSTLP
jgi:hypothetical protein